MTKDHSGIALAECVDVASGKFVQCVSVGSRAWLREHLRTLAAKVADAADDLLDAVEAADEVVLEVRVTRRPPRIDL